MGITGLIPFLENSSKRINVKEFKGGTAAIDAYCWLHKGAFACSEKLVMKEPTDMYIYYCMKFVNMLLSHNIKPILVFDGRYLPAKAATEKKRRENRELNRKKGAELLRAGRVDEARQFLRRAVDVTHEMALGVIKECRRRNIDCIVAPYEADAQLAYLSIKNIAQLVITEDSDLILFGCTRVLFKMDINGNGILVEKDRLFQSMGIRSDLFSFDKFRYMCILSGCDYLSSLPGIGLAKACKFVNRCSDTDIYTALRKLPANLNMWSLTVSDEYRQQFVEADSAFRFQLVYDPIKRCQVPLNETENVEQIVGKMLDEETAFNLALGNLNPFSLVRLDSYNPDVDHVLLKGKTNGWKGSAVTSHSSIWSQQYVPTTVKSRDVKNVLRPTTKGLSTSVNFSSYFSKRKNEDCCEDVNNDQLVGMYGNTNKRQCDESPITMNTLSDESPLTPSSPVLKSKKCKNPFAVRQSLKSPAASANKIGALAKFAAGQQTTEYVESRYFTSPTSSKTDSDICENNTADSVSLNLSQQENMCTINEVNTASSSNTPVRPVLSNFKWKKKSEEDVTRESSLRLAETDSGFSSSSSEKLTPSQPIINKSNVRSRVRTGLSRTKQSNQQTLLSMFGFQAKPKLSSHSKM